MTKHVIVLSSAHEAPTPALLEALTNAGAMARVQIWRADNADESVFEAPHETEENAPPPLAVLYEVTAGANILGIHMALEYAMALWPNAPLIAYRFHDDGAEDALKLRKVDSSTLMRLGFRAVADEATQISELLRKLEAERETHEALVNHSSLVGALAPAAQLPPKLKANRLRAAFELIAALHLTNDQRSAAHAALAGLTRLVSADRWTIYLSAETNGDKETRLEPLAVRGLMESELDVAPDDWRRALLDDTLALLSTESEAARTAFNGEQTVRRTENKRQVLALRLVSNDRPIGVLEAVRDKPKARPFTKANVELLKTLSIPIAYALANAGRIAEAERLSQTDDLTKLHNARYLRRFLVNEIKRARRYNSAVAALFLDLDDFKRINDRHGHLVGSHVLMEMAAIILCSVRDTDVVTRYGGDEFVVILPETDVKQAMFVAERVRARIARHKFTGGQRLELQLTASFGVAAFPRHALSPQQLLVCADAAMYEAKAAQKNCIRHAEMPSEEKI
jgi:diguanylate cyclase (GGDEF)-like protein